MGHVFKKLFSNSEGIGIPLDIQTLIRAILNVDSTFLFENPVVPEDTEGVTVYLERTFCYELYKQWTLLLDNKEVRLSPEIDKELWKIYNNGNSCSKCYPDFVLHNSQLDSSKQYIVAEVKRESATVDKIKNDLKKLDFMLSDDFKFNGNNAKFSNAAFIYIGREAKSMPKIDIQPYNNVENIWCLCYNGEEVNCTRLNEI